MPGLVPGIHVLMAKKTWMAGTKPGHDEMKYSGSMILNYFE